jgi:hypothetical protein
MCDVLRVSRAGYYKWRAQPLSERMKEDRVLAERIRLIHKGRRRSYGSPRVHRELKPDGVRCGEKRVARSERRKSERSHRDDTAVWAQGKRLQRTFSIASSTLQLSQSETGCGQEASPTFQLVKAGST